MTNLLIFIVATATILRLRQADVSHNGRAKRSMARLRGPIPGAVRAPGAACPAIIDTPV